MSCACNNTIANSLRTIIVLPVSRMLCSTCWQISRHLYPCTSPGGKMYHRLPVSANKQFSRFTIFLIISDLSVVHGPLKQFYVGFALPLRSKEGILQSTGSDAHRTPRSASQMLCRKFFLFFWRWFQVNPQPPDRSLLFARLADVIKCIFMTLLVCYLVPRFGDFRHGVGA